jgi:hypothetical protein
VRRHLISGQDARAISLDAGSPNIAGVVVAIVVLQ